MTCPVCGMPCEAEYVDIGVGNQRMEPWHCRCGWIEEPPPELVNTDGDDVWEGWWPQ